MQGRKGEGARASAEELEPVDGRTQWYRTLFNALEDEVLVFHLTPEGLPSRFIEVSDAACRRLGYTREELLERTLADVVDTDVVELEARLGRLRAEGKVVLESVHVAKDGRRIPVEVSAHLFDLEGKPTVLGLCRDLGARKRLADAQAYLAAIVESSDDAIMSGTPGGLIATWNAAAERIYGYSAEEAIGKPTTLVVPEDRWEESRHLLKTIMQGGRVDHVETVRRTKDGRLIDVSMAVSPIKDGSGAIVGVSVVSRNITARKRVEEALARREQQQAAIAQLGLYALEAAALQDLMQETARQVAEKLDVEYCKVLELLPDGQGLVLRAGVGWQEGVVGHAVVGTESGSQAAYTMLVGEPVVVEDLRTETRFSGPSLLHDHGVTSGLSVVIRGKDRPYGVLGAHTTRRVAFTEDDVNFVRAAAHLLSEAIARKRAAEETHFLAEAGKSLNETLSFVATLSRVATLVVPYLADWCAIDVLDDEGAIKRVAVVHSDPSKVELAHELWRRYPPEAQGDRVAAQVLHKGESVLLPEISEEVLAASARDAEHLRILQGLGLRSAIAAPLTAWGRVLGLITLVSAESGRRYRADDLPLVEELARRCAMSVENARLYRAAQDEIAERKRAQDALGESQQRLQFTLEAARVGTWDWNMTTDEVAWSDNLEEIHGLPPGSFGSTFESVLDDILPADQEKVREAIARAVAEGSPYHVEYRLPQGEGAVRWVEGKGRVLYDDQGRAVHMAGICTDITERKRAEKALLEQTHTLEIINRINSSLAGELDLERLLQAVTDAGTELSGAQFGAFFYNLINDEGESYMLYTLSGVPREAFSKFPMPRNTPIFEPTFSGSEIVRLDDVTADARYGRNEPYYGMPEGHLPVRSYLAVPVVARSGEVIGGLFFGHGEAGVFDERAEHIICGIADQAAIAIENARLFEAARREVAEREKAQAALQRLNETLEQRVAERTAALEAANHKLQEEIGERTRAEQALEKTNTLLKQRNRELQDFAYVASHDLQEPLRKIRAFADLTMTDYQDKLEENGRYYLERMQNAAERMSSLINDLLAFSRVATRARPFREVDLNEVLTGVLSDLEVAISDPEGRVETGPLPTLDADPTQMRQLLQNLIGNGLKFRRPGVPPVVQVRGYVEKSDVLTGRDEEVCRIEVEDNGIGFDEKYLDRIFSPFQRLSGRSEYPGTGIGLSISRRIVERHHGHITARSKPGEGATFIVILPLRQDPEGLAE